jgi:hypothetical protein
MTHEPVESYHRGAFSCEVRKRPENWMPSLGRAVGDKKGCRLIRNGSLETEMRPPAWTGEGVASGRANNPLLAWLFLQTDQAHCPISIVQ